VNALLRCAVFALSAASAAAQQVDFEADVLPILQTRCFDCHRGEHTDRNGRVRKPKGGLRLDGRAWIERGGAEGRVLAPGNARQSPLYTRTVLPADHDERMPANGTPLTAEQTEILRRWIDGGADFGKWIGESGPAATDAEPAPAGTAPASARTLDLARLAEGLAPLPPETVARAAGDKAKVTPLWHGSPLLRVEFAGEEDHVGDAEIAALAPLREHVAVLVLARTKVTDRACAQIARMPRLVRLDLRETAVGDAGVAQLSALPELRALNLFATEVSDASRAAFLAMPKLAELRLWQSKATAALVEELRKARPQLDVALGPALPEPAAPGEGQRGRRRGR